jgi:hypothetical protein
MSLRILNGKMGTKHVIEFVEPAAALKPPADPVKTEAFQERISRWTQNLVILLVGVPSAGLAFVSACFNALYAWGLGSDHSEKLAWIAASLALSVLVTGLPIAMAIIYKHHRMLTYLAAGLWALCLFISITSALGFASRTRDFAANSAAAVIENRGSLSREIARLEREVESSRNRGRANIGRDLAEAVSELPPEAAWQTKDCTEIHNSRGRRVCTTVLELRAELTAAQQAAGRELKLDELHARFAAMPAGNSIADPQTHILDRITSGLLGPDRIRIIIICLFVLLLEAGSSAGLLITSMTLNGLTKPQPAGIVSLEPSSSERRSIDPFARWASTCLNVRPGSILAIAEAREHFENWCWFSDFGTPDLNVFQERLAQWAGTHGVRREGSVYRGAALTGPQLHRGP